MFRVRGWPYRARRLSRYVAPSPSTPLRPRDICRSLLGRGVLVVDMGTQYTQLIARRVREAGTWCQITTPGEALSAAGRKRSAAQGARVPPATTPRGAWCTPESPSMPRVSSPFGILGTGNPKYLICINDFKFIK